MAESDSGFGLLSQYGLDLGSEKDVRSKLRQKRIADSMSLVTPNRVYGGRDGGGQREDPINQGFGRLGAALGNAIGEKTGMIDPQLPPEIANRLETMKATKAEYKAWEDSNKDAPLAARTEKYQEILADAAFKNDLPDVGMGVLRELQDRRLAKNKKETELEKLGYERDEQRDTLKSKVYKSRVEAGKAGLVEFYVTGSRDPNSSMTGQYNPVDGSVTTVNPETGEQLVLKLGEWKLDRPDWAPRSGGGSGGSGGSGGGGQKVGAHEQRGVRDQYVASIGLQKDYLEVFDLLDEAASAKAGPIIGSYGKMLSFANKWMGFADNLSTIASPTKKAPQVIVNGTRTTLLGTEPTSYDVGTNAGRIRFIKDNEDYLKSLVPDLAEKAGYADRYISMMVQLAYSKAMVSEGGSTRSLSDLDFRQNAAAAGAGLEDPNTLRSFLLTDADRTYRRATDRLKLFDSDAEIIGEDAVNEMADVRSKIEERRAGKRATPETAAERAKRMGL